MDMFRVHKSKTIITPLEVLMKVSLSIKLARYGITNIIIELISVDRIFLQSVDYSSPVGSHPEVKSIIKWKSMENDDNHLVEYLKYYK